MRGSIMEIVSGMGILIAIFLFLNNYEGTVSILKQLGVSTSSTVRTLQGR